MSATAEQTGGEVRFHRRFGMSRRRHRVPRARYPKSIEVEYGKAILAIVSRARPAFASLISEIPTLLDRARARRMDDNENEAQRARRLIQEATERMRAAIQPHDLEALAHKFATRTEQFQKGQFQKQIRAALGVDIAANDRKLPALIDHFVAENVSLIRSIPEKLAIDLDKTVARAFTGGERSETLERDIADRFDIGERHARLIARDQIGKLNGQVTAARHQSIGITSFVWTTMGDERVRDEHEALNGETFPYSNPPDEGLPGEPINCRCTGEPVFDEILDAAEVDD